MCSVVASDSDDGDILSLLEAIDAGLPGACNAEPMVDDSISNGSGDRTLATSLARHLRSDSPATDSACKTRQRRPRRPCSAGAAVLSAGLRQRTEPPTRSRRTEATSDNARQRTHFQIALSCMTSRYTWEHEARIQAVEDAKNARKEVNELAARMLNADIAHERRRNEALALRQKCKSLSAQVEELQSTVNELKAAEPDLSSAPPEYFCPITYDLMSDPVICSDGFTYEREAIQIWLKEHSTSPMTGAVLPSRHLISNQAMRTLIADYRERMKITPKGFKRPDVKAAFDETDASIEEVSLPAESRRRSLSRVWSSIELPFPSEEPIYGPIPVTSRRHRCSIM
eukprot:m.32722 g.32722  ORF g.32722 m.32722 type:complete len:342 (-) comp5569_c0_seq1:2637-3662(-)